MSQYVVTDTKTFTAGAALSKHRRVKLSAGKLAYAGVADVGIGTLEQDCFADGDVVDVRLRNLQGTVKMIAAGAVTSGAVVYAAANGKIDDTASNQQVGIALEAATADGDIIEVLPMTQTEAGLMGVASGYRLARGGGAALDGGNPTPIATGLTTIVAAAVQLRGTAAPGDNTSVLTTDFSGSDGTLNVYAWKNTSGTDPTLVASTGTETFDWIAIGT